MGLSCRCALLTCGLALTVNSLQVALQLERRQEAPETVRTQRQSVHVGTQLRHHGHVLLHVRHQPGETKTEEEEEQLVYLW